MFCVQAGALVVGILKRSSPSEVAAAKEALAATVAKLSSDTLPEGRDAGKAISAALA